MYKFAKYIKQIHKYIMIVKTASILSFKFLKIPLSHVLFTITHS